MMFYDFFAALLRPRSIPFSTIIFYCGHEHDITYTETGCSIPWFHCIIVINGDLNTLTRCSYSPAFLFVCCWSSDIFHLLLPTHGFIPRAAPYTLMCVISILRQKRIIPSSFFFLTTLITVVQILTAVVMVIAFQGLWRHKSSSDCEGEENERKFRGKIAKETHNAHCVPTYFMFHLVSWHVLLAVYLDLKWSDHGAAPRQCQKMNLMWVSGDKCSFSTEPSAKRSPSRDPLSAIYPLH